MNHIRKAYYRTRMVQNLIWFETLPQNSDQVRIKIGVAFVVLELFLLKMGQKSDFFVSILLLRIASKVL